MSYLNSIQCIRTHIYTLHILNILFLQIGNSKTEERINACMRPNEHILTSTEYENKQEKQQKSYGEQTTIRKRNTN